VVVPLLLLGSPWRAAAQEPADKDERVKKVFEMMVSPDYTAKSVSVTMSNQLFIYPVRIRLVDGKLVAWNDYKEGWNADFPPRKFSPPWVPVTIEGRFYHYHLIYYQCDLTAAKYEGAPPYCPFDVSVRGEIVSVDPPTVKEVLTVTASWSSRPNPAGCPTGVAEFVSELVPK
jgi:hypothetical protein